MIELRIAVLIKQNKNHVCNIRDKGASQYEGRVYMITKKRKKQNKKKFISMSWTMKYQ